MKTSDREAIKQLVKKLAVAKSEYKAIKKFHDECLDTEVRYIAERFMGDFKTAYFEADCELSTLLRKIYQRDYK